MYMRADAEYLLHLLKTHYAYIKAFVKANGRASLPLLPSDHTDHPLQHYCSPHIMYTHDILKKDYANLKTQKKY